MMAAAGGTPLFKVPVRFRPVPALALHAATQEQKMSQPKANKRVPLHASQGHECDPPHSQQ